MFNATSLLENISVSDWADGDFRSVLRDALMDDGRCAEADLLSSAHADGLMLDLTSSGRDILEPHRASQESLLVFLNWLLDGATMYFPVGTKRTAPLQCFPPHDYLSLPAGSIRIACQSSDLHSWGRGRTVPAAPLIAAFLSGRGRVTERVLDYRGIESRISQEDRLNRLDTGYCFLVLDDDGYLAESRIGGYHLAIRWAASHCSWEVAAPVWSDRANCMLAARRMEVGGRDVYFLARRYQKSIFYRADLVNTHANFLELQNSVAGLLPGGVWPGGLIFDPFVPSGDAP